MWTAMLAMAAAEAGKPPDRVRSLLIRPGDRCPAAVGNEVVVCRTEEEPYRIPKALRHPADVSAAAQSWVNRAAVSDEVGRVAGGLPDTCSVVGSGGQTGCAAAALRAWAAERRAMRDGAP